MIQALTSTKSRIVSMSLAFVLALGFITFFEATPAQACVDTPATMCAENVSTNTSGYNTGGGSSSGTCGSGYYNQPWVECGFVNFNRSSKTSPNGTVGAGLPGAKEGNWVRSKTYFYSNVASPPAVRLNIATRNLAFNATPSCMNVAKTYVDPVSGNTVRYYPYGAAWTDTVTWGNESSYTYTSMTTKWRKYTGNIVAWYTGGLWFGAGINNPTNSYKYQYAKPAYTLGGFTSAWLAPPGGTNYWNSSWWNNVGTAPAWDNYADIRITYGRDVQYSCYYPQAPYSVYKTCPTDIQGTMTGPYDNAATNPRFPVLIGPGQYDPKTQLKDWHIPMYSPIGDAYRRNGPNLSPSNATAYSLVVNCQAMYYNVTVNNNQCWWAGTAGPWFNNSLAPIGGLQGTSNCSFTPGNYNKYADGQQVTCKYGVYPSGYGYSGNQFVGCGGKAYNPTAHYDGKAWWCSIAPNGALGWNTTDNFATDCKAKQPNNCTWSNGTGKLTITDPYGIVQESGAQVQADGKVWTITAPTLDCPGSQNMWQQWVIADGSKPARTGLAGNNSTQPVWGSYQKTGTASFLTYAGTPVGATGWGNNVFYVKFNQATVTNDGTKSIKVGSDTSNPVTVASGSPIPFGIYFMYHYSINDTTYTNVGGNVNFNNFHTEATPAYYFYPVSGRVTG